jgi:hypothetical protein
MLGAGDTTLTTDEAGCFLLTPVPAGLYDVAADLPGYRPGSATSLHVNANETAAVEIVLERRTPGESSGYSSD